MGQQSGHGLLAQIPKQGFRIFWTYSALLGNLECHKSPLLRKSVPGGTAAAMSQQQALIDK